MNLPGFLHLGFWRTRGVPMVLQTEAAECGLASLCMVTCYWGHQIDMASIRRRFSVSVKGTTLKSIMVMAQALGLTARPLRLDMEHLPQLKLPCILHWDLNHFVVLKQVDGKHAVICDPAIGERRLTLADFAKHFSGVALELVPGNQFQKTEEIQKFTFGSLMGRIVGLKRSLVQLLMLGVTLQVCALVAPFYLQWLVDEALLASDRDLVTVLALGFLMLVVFQTAITAVRAWVTTVLATNLNFQWLGNTFIHLMKLPLSFFEKRHTGDIVSRFGSIETIQHQLTTQFVEAIIDGLLVIATFAVMLMYSVQLTAVSVVAVLLYALLRWASLRALRDAKAERIIHAAKQQTHFLESIRGVQSIRLFNRTEERRVGWTNNLADQFNADLRIARLTVSYQTVNFFLFNTERIIVIWLAALAVLDHRFSVGMLFAFIAYKEQFSTRLAALIDKVSELRMLRLHGERLADIMLTAPEDDTHAVEVDTATVRPTIEVRNVSFRYADSEPLVLDNINLTIPDGQCVAITGPSGCGKTTLVKLMLGLLEPSSGEILIDGLPLKRLGLQNYRNIIGTVMQEDSLFAGSIADNICFFDPQPDQRVILDSAVQAAVHDEIMAMPMGYNTFVGDIGHGLSGGQKQRILLARALYKGPKLLVLDEATSHLDVRNERSVNAAIQQLPLTRIIVAHRPETIAMAQRIVEMQKGSIAGDSMNEMPLSAALT